MRPFKEAVFEISWEPKKLRKRKILSYDCPNNQLGISMYSEVL
jgi:hypothetical protein